MIPNVLPPSQISRRGALTVFATVLVATVTSIVATGFHFGISNNIFHIPYVLRYSELPVFHGDAFYNSLEKFTSLVWPLLRLICNEQNIEQVFFVSHFLSRAIAFTALFWFFQANGVIRTSAIFISLITTAVCPWMMNASVVGGHGLFISYFTHSEVTWGALIAALVAAQQGRLILASIFAGIAFSINAFVGIWLMAILAVTVVVNSNQRSDWKLLATASFTFLLVCAPVAIWIIFALNSNTRVPEYNYIQYIRAYYPAHFLIEAAPPIGLRNLAIIAYCGFVSAVLSPSPKFWATTLASSVALLFMGAALPYVLNDRVVFNLHLLRVDGVLQFLASVLSVSVSIRVFLDSDNATAKRLIAVLAGSSLVTMRPEPLSLVVCAACLTFLAVSKVYGSSAGPLAILPNLSSRRGNYLSGLLIVSAIAIECIYLGVTVGSIVRWMLVLCIMHALSREKGNRNSHIAILILWALLAMAVAIAGAISRRVDSVAKANEANGAFIELTQWIRQSQLSGPFLFPVDMPDRNMFNEFQHRALKPVWVDWKQGAAVMWEPSFYWQWMHRFKEVTSLRTAEDFTAYATKKRIPNVVLPISFGNCPTDTNVIFKNSTFAICAPRFE